ncbi:hypothetical protein MVEG_00066 [Podila verticillata NRRL 6337]|nr:hypothetical protein MVEG_00066 [Podila verticillata NRRL 6337]
MSSNSTVGIYNGLPADPNAEARKMFTERENQQDGLAAILTYCQNKGGFRVGSTDTIPFRQVLKDEFSDIVEYQQNMPSSRLEKSLPGGLMPTAEDLGPFFPEEYVWRLYIAILMAIASGHTTLIQFIVRADNQLTLEVSETYTIRTDSSMNVMAFRNSWIVNRDEMARRADELMDRLKFRESIDNWARKITSDGFQQ